MEPHKLCLFFFSLSPRVTALTWPLSLPLAADREEWEQEAQMMLGVQKVLRTLAQTAEKLRQAGGRLRGQEQEMWLQQHRSPSPHIWNRPWKVRR